MLSKAKMPGTSTIGFLVCDSVVAAWLVWLKLRPMLKVNSETAISFFIVAFL
jgi:hypothetical protein